VSVYGTLRDILFGDVGVFYIGRKVPRPIMTKVRVRMSEYLQHAAPHMLDVITVTISRVQQRLYSPSLFDI
jgi:hypothetical protein